LKPGDWNKKLIDEINSGLAAQKRRPDGIAYLMDRWQVGEPVTPGTI
jgi:hypothetical protein